MPGAEALSNFDHDSTWFTFWMPDGAPAGNVKATGGYMYPDADVKPPVTNPRTIADVRICLAKAIERGGYTSPDQSVLNMVWLMHNRLASGDPDAIVIDPAEPAELLSGATAALVNMDRIEHFPAFNMWFARAGCDGRTCQAQLDASCLIKVPFPPYRLCHGPYEIKRLGFQAHIHFVWLGERQTRDVAEMATRLIDDWTTPSKLNGDH